LYLWNIRILMENKLFLDYEKRINKAKVTTDISTVDPVFSQMVDLFCS